MSQVWRSHAGFVREQTYGTTGSGAATYIPILSFDTWEDNRERILDNASRNVPSKDFFVYQGVNSGRWGASWYFYPDTMGRFLMGIFGKETVTQSSAAAPGTHVFGSTDTPPSETIYDFYGVSGSERRWHGAQMQSMELNFDATQGALTMKPTWLTFSPSTGIAETTVSYTSGVPFRGWEGALTLAGASNARLLGFKLNLQRQVDQIFPANNTQNPSAREVGPLEITGNCSFYGSTEAEYTLYRANTSTGFSLTLTDTSVASTNVLTLTFSNANFYPVTLDRSGNYNRWDVNFRALHNATDSGPGSATLVISSTVATT